MYYNMYYIVHHEEPLYLRTVQLTVNQINLVFEI